MGTKLATHDCVARGRVSRVPWTLFLDLEAFFISPPRFWRFFDTKDLRRISFPSYVFRGNTSTSGGRKGRGQHGCLSELKQAAQGCSPRGAYFLVYRGGAPPL